MDVAKLLTDDLDSAESVLRAQAEEMQTTVRQIEDVRKQAEETLAQLQRKAEQQHRELLVQQGRVESIRSMLDKVKPEKKIQE